MSGPANGVLTLNPDGSFTYTPNANFNGADSFAYRASDGSALSNIATVSIAVNPINDAPVANNDAYSTTQDTTLNVAAPGVLANDSDVEGSALAAVLVANPTNGSLTLNPDGAFTYTPNAGFAGTDSFSYKANDGLADSNLATVSITVNPAAATKMTVAVIDFQEVPRGPWTDLRFWVIIREVNSQGQLTSTPVAGATVSGLLFRPGRQWNISGTTDSTGQVTWTLQGAIVGETYTVRVDSVTHSHTYDPNVSPEKDPGESAPQDSHLVTGA
ncbi:MAG: tandem-95 repeat protein [Chloroflexi bacterium]|nr:tandem-95 repeat protein [Chloroflexota bacterium]